MSLISTYNSLSIRNWQTLETPYAIAGVSFDSDPSKRSGFELNCDESANLIFQFSDSGSATARFFTLRERIDNQPFSFNTTILNTVDLSTFPQISIISTNGISIAKESANIAAIAGRTIASGGASAITYIYDIASETVLQKIEDPMPSASASSVSVACNKDGNVIGISTVDQNNELKQFNIFERNGNSWAVTSTIDADMFIGSADMNYEGNTVVFSGGNNAKVFEKSGNTWNSTSLLSNVAGSSYGFRSSINSTGNIICIKSLPTNSGGQTIVQPSSHIWEKINNTWTETHVVFAEDYGIQILSRGQYISDDGNILIMDIYDGSAAASEDPLGLQIYEKQDGNYVLTQTVSSDEILWFGFDIVGSNDGTLIYASGLSPTSSDTYAIVGLLK